MIEKPRSLCDHFDEYFDTISILYQDVHGSRSTAFQVYCNDMPKKHSLTSRRLPIAALAMLAITASFTIGVKTASEVETVAPSEASGTSITGDLTADGIVDARDAIVILEIARGYRTATPAELRADPNGDGRLTIDDAIRILSDLSIR